MDESAIEHLRLTSKQGLSRKEMREALLAAGWPESFIKPYLEKVYKVVDESAVLQMYGVSKRFANNQVLELVDVEIKRGEIFGLIGMSGAGKTTLLNVLVGFLKPDSGDVVLSTKGGGRKSAVKDPDIIKRVVGFSTQTPSFYKKLTVRENIEHFARLYRMSDNDARRRAKALTQLVGLSEAEHVIASQLSGGMQKRLDIACALIHDPDILILDEPTADLDPVMRKQLWSLIRQINSKGTTILLASHFLAEIELLCSRIAILHNKKIAVIGTAEQLRELYAKNYEIFLQTSSKEYASIKSGVKKRSVKVAEDDGELVIRTPHPENAISFIASKLKRGDLESLHVSRPSLGRVFEKVVQK